MTIMAKSGRRNSIRGHVDGTHHCQIGGNLAAHPGSLEIGCYGAMRDLVLGLEVVLPSARFLATSSSFARKAPDHPT
jgi:FAD/FMN-containing dehydrogenase